MVKNSPVNYYFLFLFFLYEINFPDKHDNKKKNKSMGDGGTVIFF